MKYPDFSKINFDKNIFRNTVLESGEAWKTPEQIPVNVPSQKGFKIKGDVEFKNVWFSYKDNQFVLKDISFSLEEGESLAIVGATGSGKSTIINALCRFYEINKGDILFDGQSIRDINKFDLRKIGLGLEIRIFGLSG